MQYSYLFLYDIKLVPIAYFDLERRNKMVEYSKISITFSNYMEMLNSIQEYGMEGWEFGAILEKHRNSPSKGQTTYDFLCMRKHGEDIFDCEKIEKHKLN